MSNFRIHTPYGGFNTVEGFNLIYRMSYYKRWVKRDSTNKEARPQTSRLEISPILRYSFERDLLTGKLRTDLRFKNNRITLEGGRYVEQYNSNEPIHPIVNSFISLLFGDNWMKIYERNFVQLNYMHRFNDKYVLRSEWLWARRSELFNQTDYTLFRTNRGDYTANAPVNLETPNTGFDLNRAFVGAASLEARPWQKYRIRNGTRMRVQGSTPTLTLNYRKAIPGVGQSEAKFDHLEMGFKHTLKVGIRGTLDVNLQAGKFFNAENLSFMDYKHFQGNRTWFVTADPVGTYRLMDYYANSTSREYFSANTHYHFRKFLVTRIPKIRLVGITENIFVNYLASPTSRNYTEVGYGIDGILRIFRLEAAVAFQDAQYLNYGFRVGIASSIAINFND